MGSSKLSNCDFLKIPSARLVRRHCYGCSPTIVSLRLCRTFTTKNNSLNSPGGGNVRRSRSTIWQRSTNFIPATSESKKNQRSSREQWSCRRKPRRHRIRIVGQALGLPKCQRTATEAVALQFWRDLNLTRLLPRPARRGGLRVVPERGAARASPPSLPCKPP